MNRSSLAFLAKQRQLQICYSRDFEEASGPRHLNAGIRANGRAAVILLDRLSKKSTLCAPHVSPHNSPLFLVRLMCVDIFSCTIVTLFIGHISGAISNCPCIERLPLQVVAEELAVLRRCVATHTSRAAVVGAS